jgi:hypothetical protein
MIPQNSIEAKEEKTQALLKWTKPELKGQMVADRGQKH